MRRDLKAALEMLTWLPAGWLDRTGDAPDMSRAIWAYPVVGALIGAAGACVFALSARLHEPAAVAAVIALAAQCALTGALHEDGLADVADGFGGGSTRERKLEIMRDSRLGAYGALALSLAVFLRIAAAAEIGRPAEVARALTAAACIGRGAIVVLLIALPPARPDGIAAGLRARPASAGAALLIATCAAVGLLPFAAAIEALSAALATALALAWLARRQIGGFTGDVLGAGCVLAECAVLTVLARSM